MADPVPFDGARPTFECARLDHLLSVLGRARRNALLRLLVHDCRERPERLRICHLREDADGLAAEAASLADAAGQIGAIALHHAARDLAEADAAEPKLPLIEAIDEAAAMTIADCRRVTGYGAERHAGAPA